MPAIPQSQVLFQKGKKKKDKGKISSFQSLGTKSPLFCFSAWESTVPLSAWGGGVPQFSEGMVRELAIIDPRVLKQVALSSKHCAAPESESSKTGGSIFFFSLMIHFVFPQCPSQRSAIYSCLWTCLPSPGKERGGSEKVRRNHPTTSLSAWGVSPLGFRLPLHLFCYVQALERHNARKPSTDFLHSLKNYCFESLNSFLFGGLELKSSLHISWVTLGKLLLIPISAHSYKMVFFFFLNIYMYIVVGRVSPVS